MFPGNSKNLPGLPEHAAVVYRDAAAQLPPTSAHALAKRAEHFASAVRFGLDQPEAIRRLREMTGGLRKASSLASLLPRVLDGALSLMGADFGNIQLRDPVTGSLRIVTQSGFGPDFLDYFAVVDDGHSACGRAARAAAQAVIADVTADPGFAPHRGIAAASGFRAVQSTPLVDHAGRLVGMVSTHHRRPHRPPGADLQSMGLYADFAGEAIARHLGTTARGDLGDPVSRAVISALLDPGNGHAADVTGRPGSAAGREGRDRRAVHQAAEPDGTLSQFAHDIATRLFTIGLNLESARRITGSGPAGGRIAAAVEELDYTIRDIRTRVFRLAEDRGKAPGSQPGSVDPAPV
jgi:hypothetical protein